MQQAIEKVKNNKHLFYEEMLDAAKEMFQDDTPLEEIEEFLIALSKKGETAQEVAGLATIMKSFALSVPAEMDRYMDNCGTGGDGCNSFNISTTSALVLAAAGAKITKHGNRKISSAAGSSDVLEALGIHTDLTIPETLKLLEQENVTFLYAPNVHPKLKRIGQVRRKIGKPTIFNLVGPLTNPVDLETQFTGIYRQDFLMEYATVMKMLGRKRGIVVTGAGGMDEASLAGQNQFVLVDHEDLIPFSLRPEDVGLKEAPISAIRGGNPDDNAIILRELLKGKRDAYFDAVALNTGIGLFAYGTVNKIKEGVELAIDTIESGKALEKLEAVIAFSEAHRKEKIQ
ncbi:anthranilate phosphoribosyltransferase [Rummeliibacillus sp. POC4]|uniref:anthranilate phosphoribosyltransferase n=1 Tax=Rummeliibacillus sp. POC4 TaxID=2305899 RepID=UPI000E66D277|nr:anthranilate phosphoribosyltransferase [Rummeliibacillus sp. POC4]RIJ63492.1 anthranilate phosphoribosyltransferase [Rummeliibacillus sp. POC4]